FWMEFIDDFEVLAGTYQRFWNSEVPDRIYQRYWNSEFWMEPIDDLKFRVPGLWRQQVLRFLDFEDNGFFSFGLWR
ncbi:317_t:CDS:2, partial [Rhizophagus irregularis]